MERIDGALRAKLQRAVGKLVIQKTEANNLERATVARGVAHDPQLKELVCFGACLYLDVDVDPAGLLDRAVRIIELDSGGKHWHVLLTDDRHRVIHAVHTGLEDLRKYLAYIGVRVAWEFDRTRP